MLRMTCCPNTGIFCEFSASELLLKNTVQVPPEVSGIVEHLFRHDGAKMVAILARIFAIEHLNLAVHVVQEALPRALQTCQSYGRATHPSACVMGGERNLALVVRDRC